MSVQTGDFGRECVTVMDTPGRNGQSDYQTPSDTQVDGGTLTISPSVPKSIAIIPARIGSKRIPRKNIRDFSGRPIITYPLRAAHASGLFDRIVVSSDSGVVGGIAAAEKALYFHRDPKVGTNSDTASMYSVVNEVLVHYATLGELYDYVCMIYATAPFLTAARLQEGYKYILDGYQFVFPMYRTPHPERSLYDAAGSMRPRFPYEFGMNSNYWPENYHPAEGWWWANAVSLETYKGWWGERNKGVLVPKWEVQALDTEDDWREAEDRYRRGEG